MQYAIEILQPTLNFCNYWNQLDQDIANIDKLRWKTFFIKWGYYLKSGFGGKGRIPKIGFQKQNFNI